MAKCPMPPPMPQLQGGIDLILSVRGLSLKNATLKLYESKLNEAKQKKDSQLIKFYELNVNETK